METDTERQYRSVSQLKEWRQCHYRWYLAREKLDENGQRIWQRPAAWLAQGLAVHEAVEWFEKSNREGSLEDMKQVYSEAYDKHINRLAEETPNFESWFGSGWRYPAVKDIPRRYDKGLGQVERYYKYVTEVRPQDTLLRQTNGEPFVEVQFQIQLGDVWVRGVIDQVYWDDQALDWRIRDIKTGKAPGDEIQLAVYAIPVNRDYGMDITTGDYWMAESGKPTIVYDLTKWPRSRLEDAFGELDEGIRSERFDPNPSRENCMFCPVAAACEYAAYS